MSGDDIRGGFEEHVPCQGLVLLGALPSFTSKGVGWQQAVRGMMVIVWVGGPTGHLLVT